MYIKDFKISVLTSDFKQVAEILAKVKAVGLYELFNITVEYTNGTVSIVTFESRYSGKEVKDKTFKLIRILTPYL